MHQRPLQGESSDKYIYESLMPYEQRQVLFRGNIFQWTAADEQGQLKHNRILQEGYSQIAPQELIRLAKITRNGWLTNLVCPKVPYACKLNIAADLVTRYKVSTEELNEKVQKIFQYLILERKDLFDEKILEAFIADKMESVEVQNIIMQNAKNEMKEKYPNSKDSDLDYQEKSTAFQQVETEKMKKEITHAVLRENLDNCYNDPKFEEKFNLQYKPLYVSGENNDFLFLGAAGSGKSTLKKNLIKNDLQDYVTVATDDYRGVILDEKHESLTTDQIFIRTQDTAYSIKELVQKRLETGNKRPNTILDGISLEVWQRKLLSTNAHTTSVVACLCDIGKAPGRAFSRAMESKDPADKGRQVNTTSLLWSHVLGSFGLLLSIPENIKTTLYATDLAPPSATSAAPAVPIATIDTRDSKYEVEISNLARMANFVGKAKANVEATFKGELYSDPDVNKTHRFTFDVHYQAEQLLRISQVNSPWAPKGKNYTLILKNDGIPYASISMDPSNKLQLVVTNKESLLSLLNAGGEDAALFKSMAVQVYWQQRQNPKDKMTPLEKAREEMSVLGKENAAMAALRQWIPKEAPQKDENTTVDLTPTSGKPRVR